ncbi:uncharacterized protein LOC118964923 isoform X2 [Oncorhynchus mykiss]|uniref:uncharacterized protein LOC118964922 isoform X2 n=1 Tax=Oncorhynchus mykiss TaxID=8022 RepID=UPI0018783CEC|nr:uncharacterized protein LOC118964922 isoform X2 [Oncorhynchus mykiss]XP_036836684.1 uncharacterized protein LOC118964923 isoform X2 [Oncorhynchus mykiss]
MIMDMLSVFMVMTLVGKCQGNTYLNYQEKEEAISLQCEERIWQLDLNEDNMVDCTFNCSLHDNEKKCDQDPKCNNTVFTLEKTPCKNSIKQCLNMKLGKHVTGFFACFHTFPSNNQHLFPFKPSKHQVESFIVAFVEPEMVIFYSDVETKTSVTKQHGESVNLACNFTVAKDYSHLPFSLYWIKTVSGNSSTCLYSYSFDSNGQLYDHHCLIDEALLKRRSNTSSIPLTVPIFHNLKISNATYSDSGQYVCALQVLKNRKGHWKVITNVTVTVNGEFNNHPNRNDTALLYTPGDPYIPLYVVGALFFFCLFVTVIVMMKNTKISQESHTLRMKREDDAEETINSDCSPYAEGRGEDGGALLTSEAD